MRIAFPLWLVVSLGCTVIEPPTRDLSIAAPVERVTTAPSTGPSGSLLSTPERSNAPSQRADLPFAIAGPDGFTLVDSTRYGIATVTAQRGDITLDISRFDEAMTLERFEGVTSRGEGYLEAIRREATPTGFILVNTRETGTEGAYHEIAVGDARGRTVCTATRLRTVSEVERHLDACHALRFETDAR